jgi:hypothetical protein
VAVAFFLFVAVAFASTYLTTKDVTMISSDKESIHLSIMKDGDVAR